MLATPQAASVAAIDRAQRSCRSIECRQYGSRRFPKVMCLDGAYEVALKIMPELGSPCTTMFISTERGVRKLGSYMNKGL